MKRGGASGPSRRVLLLAGGAAVCAGSVGAISLAQDSGATPRPLRSIFDRPPSRRPTSAVSSPSVEPPPAPVVRLDMQSMYQAGSGSTQVDPGALEAYRARLRPIQAYTRRLTLMADACVMLRAPPAALRRGVVEWLAHWARAGALTEGVTEQGRSVRAWELAPIACSWQKVRRDAAVRDGERALIDQWIDDLRGQVAENQATGQERNSRNNNHSYWAAWSTMCAAIARDDIDAFGRSRDVFERAMTQIDADGVLPLELARRNLALHYHNFALAPLVLLAEALIANNYPSPWGDEDAPLQRLADLTLNGFADPEVFESLAGEPQTISETISASQLAWMEPYYARTRDTRTNILRARFQPMVSPRLGGDLTYYFAEAA